MKRITIILVLTITLVVFLMAMSTSVFAEKVSISFSYNSIKGGRGTQSAEWIEDVSTKRSFTSRLEDAVCFGY